ncbi:MAG: 2-dehydropantoate 2-reductase N-terminal domain-containing protein [Microvirga sp.]
MRIIIYGVGAIGGTIAAALALSGQDVIGIARGPHLEAIKANGLLMRTPPDTTQRALFPCFGDPIEIDFGLDDAILLAMKSQDTVAALERLRAAGVSKQPIFCVQNGVANERFALRRFPEVHGVTVMMPASHSTPGEVIAFGTPRYGIFDIGRYPVGSNSHDSALAEALERANFAAFVMPDVMESKYGKLILNLRNIVEASLGVGTDQGRLGALLRAEAEAVMSAAGIAWRDVGSSDPRRSGLMRHQPVAGIARSGGSSTQSLARGTGSIETDYLNGEIVLLGREHGVPVPVNAFFAGLGARLVRDRLKPGAVSVDEIKRGLAAAGVVAA